MPSPSSEPDSTTSAVVEYYRRIESRVGYRLLLGGTKHFGWYEPGQSRWRFSQAMRQMEDELAGWIGLPAGSQVLDAGCGMGDVACRLAGTHGLQVTGVDLLDFNIAEATRRAAARGLTERTQFLEGDYTTLELAPASFGAIYTMETLVHVGDVEQALSTFHRLLRPGGKLVLVEYSHRPYDELDPATAAAIRRVNELAAMPGFDRFADGVLPSLLEDAGFTGVETRDVTERMLPMLSAFSTLARGPYALGRTLGLTSRMVNAMSGVEFWRHRGAWSYNVVSGYREER